MKRSEKPVQYSSDEESEEADNEPDSTWAEQQQQRTPAPVNRTPGTGGKQPVSNPPTPSGVKPPPRPTTAGKQPVSQPNVPAQPKTGTGGKQPDLSPQKVAAMKRTGSNPNPPATKPSASTAGKGPTAYGSNSSTNQASRSNAGSNTSARPSTGGKEPQTRYQPSSHLNSGNKLQGSLTQARPQTLKKQHPLIGKTVKVFYVPEGYFTGLVRSQIGESEFMINWEDGSVTSAVLKDEDETEDPDNEDRWSLVEDFESTTTSRPEKPVSNGRNKTPPQPKAPPKQSPPAPARPKPQPATYEEDEEQDIENDDPDNLF